jgi:hypothetical protein
MTNFTVTIVTPHRIDHVRRLRVEADTPREAEAKITRALEDGEMLHCDEDYEVGMDTGEDVITITVMETGR